MSQAPEDEQNVERMQDPKGEFRRHLDRLNDLIRDGGSLSGREKNCVFLNTGGEWFATISGISGLDFDDDARAPALVDWDRDGDVDVWVANRTAPQVRYLRNDAPRAGNFLALQLVGDGRRSNRDAIGARVDVVVGGSQEDAGELKTIKTVHAGEGFLSQSSKWLHFGLGDAEEIAYVTVRWPGGEEERFDGVTVNGRFRLVQGQRRAEPLPTEGAQQKLAAAPLPTPKVGDANRVLLSNRVPSPPLRFQQFDDREAEVKLGRGKPVLVNVWASWCQPCLVELASWKKEFGKLQQAGLEVYALSVDAIDDNQSAGTAEAAKTAERLDLPFETGILSKEHYRRLEQIYHWPFGRRIPMPAPASLLFDGQGRLAAIYRGPVEVEQLQTDLNFLKLRGQARLAAVLPYPGVWINPAPPQRPIQVAIQLMDKGDVADAASFVRRNRELLFPHKEFVLLAVWLGDEFSKRDMMRDALGFYADAVKRDPKNLTLMNNLAWQLATNRNDDVRRPTEAIRWAERAAAATNHKNPGVLDTLSVAYAAAGRFEEAVRIAEQARGLAEAANDEAMSGELQRRIEMFSAKRPYRED